MVRIPYPIPLCELDPSLKNADILGKRTRLGIGARLIFLFPYKVDRPFSTPWATIGLIFTCCLFFLIELTLPDAAIDALAFKLDGFGVITWLSAMFMHVGLLHLLGNMYFLWLFGSVVEDTLGPVRYLAIYMAGGFASAVLHGVMMAIFVPEMVDVPLVGASGAIAALFGIFAVRFRFNKIRMVYGIILRYGRVTVPATLGVALWVARELVDGLIILGGAESTVASWAHIGGVVLGLGAAWWLKLNREALDEQAIREAAVDQDFGLYRRLADGNSPASPVVSPTHGFGSAPGAFADSDAAAAYLRAALDSGRGPEAVAAFVRMRETDTVPPLDAMTLNRLGRACEQADALSAAAAIYYDLVQNQPASAEAEPALFRLAHVYLRMGYLLEAQQAFWAFRTRYPASVWMPYADGRLGHAPAS